MDENNPFANNTFNNNQSGGSQPNPAPTPLDSSQIPQTPQPTNPISQPTNPFLQSTPAPQPTPQSPVSPAPQFVANPSLPLSMEPPQGPTKKNTSIIFVCIASGIFVVILVLSIVFIKIVLDNQANQLEPTDSYSPMLDHADTSTSCPQHISFDSLTKETALTYITATHKNLNCAIQNITDDEDLRLSDGATGYTLLYSYSSPSEINDIANNSSMNLGRKDDSKINFEIIQKDHYAIVRHSEETKSAIGIEQDGIIFDKKYFDYRREQTEGASFNDVHTFTNTDEDWVETALKILAITDSNLSSIYDVDFAKKGTGYVSTKHCVGIGVDTDKLEGVSNNTSNNTTAIPYAINLYDDVFSVNVSTGAMSHKKSPSGDGYYEKIKSFSLTNEEAAKVL